MSVIISTLVAMGSKILTGKVIEKAVILLVEELVKRTSSKADDELLKVVKEALK